SVPATKDLVALVGTFFDMSGPVEHAPATYRLLSTDLAGNGFAFSRPFVCQVHTAQEAVAVTSFSLYEGPADLGS
ncbi:hypothetical protein EV175_006111, partial [Coemansia sp. RSA 1933]